MTLAGLISRWITPRLWAKATASHTRETTPSARVRVHSPSGSGGAPRSRSSVSPWTESTSVVNWAPGAAGALLVRLAYRRAFLGVSP